MSRFRSLSALWIVIQYLKRDNLKYLCALRIYFAFSVRCIVIYIYIYIYVNQQIAHFFHYWFNAIILSSTCFEQLSFHHQEVCTSCFTVFFLYIFVYFIFWVSNTSWQRPDCLCRCMIQYRKADFTVLLMINTWLFETCRRQYIWIKSLIKKFAFFWFFLHMKMNYLTKGPCQLEASNTCRQYRAHRVIARWIKRNKSEKQ